MNNKLITVKQLSKLLNISRSYAYQLVKLKDFPIIRINRKILIKEYELNDWLDNNKNIILKGTKNYE